MVLAMLCLLAPTVGRIANFGLFGLPVPAVMLPLYLPLLAALPLYEWRSGKGLHLLSLLGPAVIFLAAVLGAFVLPNFGPARAIVGLF